MAKDCLFEAKDISLRLSVPEEVYEPAEDSELFVKCALDECEGSVLEVGCGSGVVCISLAKAKKCGRIAAVDINPAAVKCAKMNAGANLSQKELEKLKIIESDLFEKIKAGEKFDWIIFNPPYLPTSADEKVAGVLNHAFDGGNGGLDVARRFLVGAKARLKKGGKILLVASSLQPKKEMDALLGQFGYKNKVLAQDSFFFEKLQVLELWPK